MTETPRRRLVVSPPANAHPDVAAWLWAMEDCRHLTLEVLEGLTDAEVDRPGPDGTTIGTLLHHVAAIEASWLYEEVLLHEFPPAVEALLTHPVRADGGRLYPVLGEPVARHLERLALVRAELLAAFRGMDAAELARVRVLPQYDVSPLWVLHHLL